MGVGHIDTDTWAKMKDTCNIGFKLDHGLSLSMSIFFWHKWAKSFSYTSVGNMVVCEVLLLLWGASPTHNTMIYWVLVVFYTYARSAIDLNLLDSRSYSLVTFDDMILLDVNVVAWFLLSMHHVRAWFCVGSQFWDNLLLLAWILLN